jgi:hypothetical protein
MSFENDAPVDLGTATPFAAVRAAFLANVTLTNPAIEADGVELDLGDRVLLAAQTSATQGGIYAYGVTGAELTPGGSFADGVTPINVTGLTAGKSYYWDKGTHTASLTNGVQVLTASALFVAAGTSVTLLGTGGQSASDSVKAVLLTRTTDANEDAEFVRGKRVRVSEGDVFAGAVFACAVETETVISVPAAIAFVVVSAPAPEPDSTVTFENAGPVNLT